MEEEALAAKNAKKMEMKLREDRAQLNHRRSIEAKKANIFIITLVVKVLVILYSFVSFLIFFPSCATVHVLPLLLVPRARGTRAGTREPNLGTLMTISAYK